jgi:hypothetical protein
VKSLGGAHSALRAEILIGFIVTDLLSAAAFEDATVKTVTPHKMVVRTDFMKPPKIRESDNERRLLIPTHRRRSVQEARMLLIFYRFT